MEHLECTKEALAEVALLVLLAAQRIRECLEAMVLEVEVEVVLQHLVQSMSYLEPWSATSRYWQPMQVVRS